MDLWIFSRKNVVDFTVGNGSVSQKQGISRDYTLGLKSPPVGRCQIDGDPLVVSQSTQFWGIETMQYMVILNILKERTNALFGLVPENPEIITILFSEDMLVFREVIHIPRTQMTLILIGKGRVLEGWPWKIEQMFNCMVLSIEQMSQRWPSFIGKLMSNQMRAEN